MIAFLVSAPLRLLRSRGPLAAMKPGSQTAEPLHSEPPPAPRHVREPWRDSIGVAKRRARLAEEQGGGRP